MKYFIGEHYRYANGRQKFRLKSVNGFVFRFECGHWCTDNVFMDLIRMKTNTQVYKDQQLNLQFTVQPPRTGERKERNLKPKIYENNSY